MAVPVDLDDQRLVACTSRAADPARAVSELAAAIGSVQLAGALLFCSNGYPEHHCGLVLRRALEIIQNVMRADVGVDLSHA